MSEENPPEKYPTYPKVKALRRRQSLALQAGEVWSTPDTGARERLVTLLSHTDPHMDGTTTIQCRKNINSPGQVSVTVPNLLLADIAEAIGWGFER